MNYWQTGKIVKLTRNLISQYFLIFFFTRVLTFKHRVNELVIFELRWKRVSDEFRRRIERRDKRNVSGTEWAEKGEGEEGWGRSGKHFS